MKSLIYNIIINQYFSNASMHMNFWGLDKMQTDLTDLGGAKFG